MRHWALHSISTNETAKHANTSRQPRVTNIAISLFGLTKSMVRIITRLEMGLA